MRTIRNYVAAIAAAALLAGCGLFGDKKKDDEGLDGLAVQTQGTPARSSINASIAQAFLDVARQPLVKFECPEAGCLIKSLEVGNPMSIMELSRAFQVALAPAPVQPPWWAQPINTVISALAQVGSIKFGLAGVGNIVSSVVGGMATVSGTGFNALVQQGGQAFSAYDRSMQTALNGYAQRPPNVTNTYTWDVSGNGNNFGSGQLSYSNAPISNSYNPVNPAARVCFMTPTGQSCSP
jgi:hypothetical protein